METFTTHTSYDASGRVDVLTYPATTVHPSGFKVQYVYATSGFLDKVVDPDNPTTHRLLAGQ